MLEKIVEGKVCAYAQSKGCLTYKFTSPARTAVPDRIFISPKGEVWFVEFKRRGKVPTPAQEREHHRLRMQNVAVYVIDNVEDGQSMVDEHA
jgi:hypothetical protein